MEKYRVILERDESKQRLAIRVYKMLVFANGTRKKIAMPVKLEFLTEDETQKYDPAFHLLSAEPIEIIETRVASDSIDPRTARQPHIVSFEIPGLPSTSNELNRMHYKARSAESKYWKNLVIQTVYNMRPPKSLTRAYLTLVRRSSVQPDYDNLVHSFKHVIDGLVIGKVLYNDRPSNIGVPEYKWEKADENHGCISVRVEERFNV